MVLVTATAGLLTTCGTDAAGPGETRPSGFVPMTELAAGAWHTCAILAVGDGPGVELELPSGPAVCWGRNDEGQLGTGGMGGFADRARRVSTDQRFFRLAAGEAYTCGLSPDGRLHCWGGGLIGGGSPIPAPVAGDLRFHRISAGDRHLCALTVDGLLYCWGANPSGQVGDGSTTDREAPVQIPGTFMAVAAGRAHTCAVTRAARGFCWGSNDHGQLGIGEGRPGASTPQAVAPALAWAEVSAGADHTCALTPEIRTGGKPGYCWGSNEAGQLGTPSVGRGGSVPTEISPTLAFRELVAGGRHSCGIVHDLAFTGSAPNNVGYCWGANDAGQLGNGAARVLVQPSPAPVDQEPELLEITTGREHTCAVWSGTGFCWGSNGFGQLGNGAPDPVSYVPAQVKLEADTAG